MSKLPAGIKTNSMLTPLPRSIVLPVRAGPAPVGGAGRPASAAPDTATALVGAGAPSPETLAEDAARATAFDSSVDCCGRLLCS